MQRAAAAGGLLRSGRRGFSHAHLLQYSKKGLNVNLFKAFGRVLGKASDKTERRFDEAGKKGYNSGSHLKLLRGWVQFPTGGIARELRLKTSADPVMIPEPTVQSG